MATRTERLPPHSLEAEQSAIGAMLLSREAVRDVLAIVTPSDFYAPKHQMIVAHIARLHATGEVIDVVSVAAELGHDENWLQILLEAQTMTPSISAAERYAEVVSTAAARRQIISTAAELIDQAYANDDVHHLIDFAQGRLAETSLRAAAREDDVLDKLTTFEQFRAHYLDKPIDWAIRDVLARKERALIVSSEGAGKSTLTRQIAIAIGGGVHPFTQGRHEQLATLVLDLENSERTVGVQAGLSLDGASHLLQGPNDAWLLHEEGGIDLRSMKAQVYLERAMQVVRPAILVIGPIYKATETRRGENWDDVANGLMRVLDDFRVRFDCAIILEHHAPKGAGIRELLPFGSSAWMRWPEFGIKLEPDGFDRQGRPLALNVGNFRGQRVDGDWPDRLVRGGSKNLPWVHQPRPR